MYESPHELKIVLRLTKRSYELGKIQENLKIERSRSLVASLPWKINWQKRRKIERNLVLNFQIKSFIWFCELVLTYFVKDCLKKQFSSYHSS